MATLWEVPKEKAQAILTNSPDRKFVDDMTCPNIECRYPEMWNYPSRGLWQCMLCQKWWQWKKDEG